MDAVPYLDPVLIGLIALALALIALITTIVVILRQRKLLSRYRLLLAGQTGRNIEQMLLDQSADLERIHVDLEQLIQRMTDAEAAARFHVQRTAIVRFNAFPDTGSDLSFAIALLDANNDGLVFSSLYGRHESRAYAKPIKAGKSTYQLTDEEKQALANAMARA